jgi:hypothetical protein
MAEFNKEYYQQTPVSMALVQDVKDHLKDLDYLAYKQGYKLATTALQLRKARPKRGSTNVQHEALSRSIDDVLANLNEFDAEHRPDLERRFITKHNKAAAELRDKVHALTVASAEKALELQQLGEEIARVQKEVIDSYRVCKLWRSRGYETPTEVTQVKSGWGAGLGATASNAEMAHALGRATLARAYLLKSVEETVNAPPEVTKIVAD